MSSTGRRRRFAQPAFFVPQRLQTIGALCQQQEVRSWHAPDLRKSQFTGLKRARTSPVLARNGHHGRAERLPLSGVEQTSIERCKMSGDDPKRTLARLFWCDAVHRIELLKAYP